MEWNEEGTRATVNNRPVLGTGTLHCPLQYQATEAHIPAFPFKRPTVLTISFV